MNFRNTAHIQPVSFNSDIDSFNSMLVSSPELIYQSIALSIFIGCLKEFLSFKIATAKYMLKLLTPFFNFFIEFYYNNKAILDGLKPQVCQNIFHYYVEKVPRKIIDLSDTLLDLKRIGKVLL